MIFVYYYFRIICKTLYSRISYWNKKGDVSILNKCDIYCRFSEISAWRQVCIKFQALPIWIHYFISWGRGHGCDNIVVVFTTLCAISSNPVHGEVYSRQHYMIKFLSNFRQVSGFPRVLQFPQPIKTDRHDITETLLKALLNTITQSKLILIPSSPLFVFIP